MSGGFLYSELNSTDGSSLCGRCARYPCVQIFDVKEAEDAQFTRERSGFLVDLSAETEKIESVGWRIVLAGPLVTVEVVDEQLPTIAPGWSDDSACQSELPDSAADLRR
jgi:hypothetical protein